jgi:hypothetical protein
MIFPNLFKLNEAVEWFVYNLKDAVTYKTCPLSKIP